MFSIPNLSFSTFSLVYRHLFCSLFSRHFLIQRVLSTGELSVYLYYVLPSLDLLLYIEWQCREIFTTQIFIKTSVPKLWLFCEENENFDSLGDNESKFDKFSRMNGV